MTEISITLSEYVYEKLQDYKIDKGDISDNQAVFMLINELEDCKHDMILKNTTISRKNEIISELKEGLNNYAKKII